MGKKVLYTGSRLLGQELRRLRGTRTLGQICALSHAPPLSEHCASIAEPTLSQVERGISMPTLESMYTLSVIYRVSMQQLQGLVVEERLARDIAVPDTLDEVRDRFDSVFRSGDWYASLALAIRGERLADTETRRVGWRVNRAMAMERLGMRQEALFILLECAHSPDLDPQFRFFAHRALASAYTSCGFLDAAAESARLALELVPREVPPPLLVALLYSRARLLQYQYEEAAAGVPVGTNFLEEADELLSRATLLTRPESIQDGLILGLLKARGRALRGEITVAEASFLAVRAAARAGGNSWHAMVADSALGSLYRRSNRPTEARQHLESAEMVARGGGYVDEAFEVGFELHLLAVEAEDRRAAASYLRQCWRLYPLLAGRTPTVRAFERLGGTGR
jgi:tetratricopeptide (TPR) repeat protein